MIAPIPNDGPVSRKAVETALANLTDAARDNVLETGTDVERDVQDMRNGKSAAALLADCLQFADADRVQGWHEYVDAVVAGAAVRS
jgi:hypothetical protein